MIARTSPSRPRPSRRRSLRRPGNRWLAVAVTTLTLAGVLAGCGGSSSNSTASGGAPAVAEPQPAQVADNGSSQSGASSADSLSSGTTGEVSGKDAAGTTTLDPTAVGPQLVRTATLAVTVPDLATAAAHIRAMVVAASGLVVQESIVTGKPTPTPEPGSPEAATSSDTSLISPMPPTGQSVMVLRVPAERLDAMLDDLAGLGTLTQRTSNTTDVTSRVVDTQSRLATMKASVARVRALMDQATTVSQIVQIEGELSTREANLEALEATLKSLTDQVAMATVTVVLTPAGAVFAPTTTDGGGFLAGLAAGWDALVTAGSAVLTAVGAALPFLPFALLLALPVWRWRRRRAHVEEPDKQLVEV